MRDTSFGPFLMVLRWWGLLWSVCTVVVMWSLWGTFEVVMWQKNTYGLETWMCLKPLDPNDGYTVIWDLLHCNNTPVYPSSIPDSMLPGRYFGLVVHCWAPLSSASELMHSYTSDPSPSPLHLIVVKVPRCQIQCSSHYHQLFNFFVNVGMVWCWWATHVTSTSMRFGPLMYDFDIRRCDMVEGDGEHLCEWKCFLCWYSCTSGFIRIVLVTVSESCRRVFLIKVIVIW